MFRVNERHELLGLSDSARCTDHYRPTLCPSCHHLSSHSPIFEVKATMTEATSPKASHSEPSGHKDEKALQNDSTEAHESAEEQEQEQDNEQSDDAEPQEEEEEQAEYDAENGDGNGDDNDGSEYESSDDDNNGAGGNVGLSYLLEDVSAPSELLSATQTLAPNAWAPTCSFLEPLSPVADSTTTMSQRTKTFTSRKRKMTRMTILVSDGSPSTRYIF